MQLYLNPTTTSSGNTSAKIVLLAPVQCAWVNGENAKFQKSGEAQKKGEKKPWIREIKNSGPRILAVPFPSSGHTNPMMQLCKRLVSKGLKATMALTKFSAKTLKGSTDLVQIETVSDGGDEAGISDRDTEHDVLSRLKKNGSESLAPLINKYQSFGDPIVCVIYDSLLLWVVEVPKKFGLVSVAFFTQQSAVNFFVYHFYHKLLPYPVVELPASIPGLPLLEHQDFPKYGMFPYHQEFVAGQFSTVKMADIAFVNTFYKLEEEVSSMSVFFSW
ncbi:UDP-glycosyltransferase 74F2 [Abeliophyllum distichum]|uniref:UDP-glycosyltransferase 74F2 n=1 Tax=Abeliophyllum distichum TaxID=126358 RepID=A0ABD1R9H8_9LAMI